MTLNDVQKKIRKANRSNYFLYLFCNFISLMLITGYAAMMMSPTVLNVFPDGGDSRKQVVAIFILTCVGCVVFTIYGVNLFYRMKSKEIGILMAFGATRRRLAPGVIFETIILSGSSALAGIFCGMPFTWILWKFFSSFIVDSEEMKLTFDYKYLLISLIFFILVLVFAILMGIRYLKKTNIIEVIQEEHRSEPVGNVKKWYGIVGVILLLFGAVSGYSAPGIYVDLFSAYPAAWLKLLYVPIFVGLYMILLHVVVHGFPKKKNPYKGLISRSMMKFQGKQTVNNLMVVTVLIAGGCFGIFYIPMLITGLKMELKERTYDYYYLYPHDEELFGKEQVEQMAADYGVSVSNWNSVEYATLSLDGTIRVEEGTKFHNEYREYVGENKFISESAYSQLTGEAIDIPEGSYYAINNELESLTRFLNTEATRITNMTTRDYLPIEFKGMLHYTLLTDEIGYYVIDDKDYEIISAGLPEDWKGNVVCFNAGETDSYSFSKALFNEIVDSFEGTPKPSFYDRVVKMRANEDGEIYWGDTPEMTQLSYENRDAADFRLYWSYMPKFKVMDDHDKMNTFAVFLMMFLFIAIVCLVAAMIICYTRCMTIAINNRYVFDNLNRLGASPKFLKKEVKSQSIKVFMIPASIGMGMMYLLYCMIMYGNDGRLTLDEGMGLLGCFMVLVGIGAIIYGVYRMTVNKMVNRLEIN